MIRFGIGAGIHDVQQLKSALAAGTFNDRNISIELYPFAQTLSDELAEAIMFQLTDDRGVLKRTYSERFKEFDRAVIGIIDRRFNGDEAIRIHDMAVSDARTACDFYENMSRSLRRPIQYLASDYSPEAVLYTIGPFKAILSANGQLAQIVCPPFVINCRHWRMPAFVKNQIIRYIKTKERRGAISKKSISLFCARALDLAKSSSEFRLRQHDLLRPQDESNLDIVRTMNIFNLAYFTSDENRVGVDNIFRSLRAGGLFIVGSNEGPDSIIDGGVYVKSGNRFELIESFGAGPRIKEAVDGYRCGASPTLAAKTIEP